LQNRVCRENWVDMVLCESHVFLVPTVHGDVHKPDRQPQEVFNILTGVRLCRKTF
jgi:hypothetical protein